MFSLTKRISADAARLHGPPTVCLLSQLVMSESKQQQGHEGSRADYITSLALARSHAEIHGRFFTSHTYPKNHHDDTPTSRHMPKRLQTSAIPDLRFEPTYMAKLASAGSDWKSVVWITVRDHAISPLLQGVLWCVASLPFSLIRLYVYLTIHVHRGAASIFVQPLMRSLLWWRHQHDISPQKEGSVAGWLRQWARSLFPHTRSGVSLEAR
jgi:hypothetical protein